MLKGIGLYIGIIGLFYAGYSIVNAEKELEMSAQENDSKVLQNIYFTGNGNIASVYIKLLAENILYNHGIQAEVTVN